MRVIPLITAACVGGVLYLIVMERDFLRDFVAGGGAGGAEPAESVVASDAASTAAEVAPGQASAAERRVPVVAIESAAERIDNAVLLRGRTQASRQVEVRAETSGRVISPPLPAGSAVAEGMVLCRLDPGTSAARLEEAEARLAEAELVSRNADALSAGGFAAETRAVTARTALLAARTAREAAARDVERLEIRAPFSGVIERESAELGSLLQPGAVCATVIELDPILLVGFAAEADIARIGTGAMAAGRLATGGDVLGRVSFVSRSSDPQTGTFRVEATVANPGLAVRDGQTVDILIATEGTSGHLVPASALTLDDAGQLGVRTVDENSRARFVPLRVLRDTAQGVWVAGLPDTARVIVTGQEYVVDGVLLEVTLREARP